MKKISIITLSVLGLIVIGGLAWAYSNYKAYAPTTYIVEKEGGATTTVTTVNTETKTETPGSPTYTMAEVATHNNATSCYTVISGKVYDLTMWVAMHPGGKQAILSLCGVDGTARFSAKHGTDSKPNTALARFKIGVLN